MSRLRLLHLQRRQGDAAAAKDAGAGGVDDIAAQGADIELGAQHIPRPIVVGDTLAGEQLRHGHAQVLRQRLQQGDVRKTSAVLPLGHGLIADTEPVSQLLLGVVLLLPQCPDGGAGDILGHRDSSFWFLPSGYQTWTAAATYAA